MWDPQDAQTFPSLQEGGRERGRDHPDKGLPGPIPEACYGSPSPSLLTGVQP